MYMCTNRLQYVRSIYIYVYNGYGSVILMNELLGRPSGLIVVNLDYYYTKKVDARVKGSSLRTFFVFS